MLKAYMVRERLGIPGIERSQLRWFGHLSRMSHEKLVRQVVSATLTGKPPRDRPRTRWSD